MRDDDLDDMLALAARSVAEPSDDLMRRVLAEALALQPSGPVLRTAPAAPRLGLLARVIRAFGGRAALAGMGTAAVFGLMIGYLNPTSVDYLTGASTDSADLFPDADFLATEG